MATPLWYTIALIFKQFRLFILWRLSVIFWRFLRLSWLGVGSSFPGGSLWPLWPLHLLLPLWPPNNLGSFRLHQALLLNMLHQKALGCPAPCSPLGPLALRMPIKGGIHLHLGVLLKFQSQLAASPPLALLLPLHIHLLGLCIFCIPPALTPKALTTLPFPWGVALIQLVMVPFLSMGNNFLLLGGLMGGLLFKVRFSATCLLALQMTTGICPTSLVVFLWWVLLSPMVQALHAHLMGGLPCACICGVHACFCGSPPASFDA